MKDHVDTPALKLGPELRVDPDQPAARAAPTPDQAPEEPKGDMRGRTAGQDANGRHGRGPRRRADPPETADTPRTGGGGGGRGPGFHKRVGPEDFNARLQDGRKAVWSNMSFVLVLTCATNLLILAIPIYLFQISDRVLTSRSTDTLIMLTAVIGGAVIMYAVFDAIRRFILMRTAVEVAAQLGAPVLSAAAHASLHGTGREYQTLGDLQQVRAFLVSGTLLSILDVPFAPLFVLVIYFIHPHLGMIVIITALALLLIGLINQKITERPFAEANFAQSKANQHLDSMARNSQIINALAMIPEAVTMWGRDTAASLIAQVRAQDRNIISASISRGIRLLTQVAMLGWGAYLAIDGQITGGMVIAASIIAGRALAPIEGSIEGWNALLLSRAAYGRIAGLLSNSRLQFERLRLPRPEGRLDVERLLYVPGGTKQVVLNGISFSLNPGETLAVIGNSGAGKTTLGKMLVGSILPTSGNVRLDLMDLRNWDPRQLGENLGYLPQDVQLFPGTIKDNIARMRHDATDEQVHRAAVLADVHEMIAQLPQGYETLVAADGAPLSGGQKQRIALARAFFGNPRLVVLDEPNSNLDTAGDRALARAIEHARENCITVVVITQKPALLSVVDKIMVLANGAVALFGTRDRVLEQINGRPQARGEVAETRTAPPSATGDTTGKGGQKDG
jgi:ATP-binding cassette, subfamily C, bacterial